MAIVVWGAWNAQTDCYPLNEHQARPSWYVYGWPVCFATSGRGRLNFVSFDAGALAVDLFITLVLVACTLYASEALLGRFPQVTIRDMLAIMTGLSVAFVVWSGGMNWLAERSLGAVQPPADMSASAGDAQTSSRLSWLIILPISLGLASLGFTLFKLPFLCFSRSTVPHPDNGRTDSRDA